MGESIHLHCYSSDDGHFTHYRQHSVYQTPLMPT